ncbi:hypothetical protein C8J56DRAFT_281850 [Mycena floridula]|nr:hypothetical protein C8J56DRAFT_281850 [Mycena floridula]
MDMNPSASAHFLEIKKEIAASYPDFQERATRAWGEILVELTLVTDAIKKAGQEYIPQVKFSELDKLSSEEIARIKRTGTVVIKDIVDDEQARAWKDSLAAFVKANPGVDGFPVDDKQFFQLYWTQAQVQARAHPNMLKASTWLNNLYHERPGTATVEGVDLNVPLSYADRFRMRHPGVAWEFHPPHIDGGSIERWEDRSFRTCFHDILSGDWRKHDAYDITGRINARASLYKRPGQATVFRTFQGWLAVSPTGPSQGTLKVFPDVLLSNSYLILRPFFKPLVPTSSVEAMDPKNWEFDISTPEFPGILPRGTGFAGPRPTPEKHPNLRLEDSMTSVPTVNPGDAVFWHCDVVHAVETMHTGSEDASGMSPDSGGRKVIDVRRLVMYIPAVPKTPMNQAYVERQRECFLKGIRPPDFPQGVNETDWTGIGTEQDIKEPAGRIAMGLPIAVA